MIAGVSTNEEGRHQAGMGVDCGDWNGDGRLDLFVTNFNQDWNTLYTNQGNLLFSDDTYRSGLGVAEAYRYMGNGESRLSLDNGKYDFRADCPAALIVDNGDLHLIRPVAEVVYLGLELVQVAGVDVLDDDAVH